MKLITLYMSHPIRGLDGDKCTYEKKWENIEKAIRAASLIEYVLNQQLIKYHVAVRLYVPGEHELLFETLLDLGYIDMQKGLEADCHIMNKCDGTLFCLGELPQRSPGMEKEYQVGKENHQPQFTIPTPMDEKCIEAMVEFVRSIAGVTEVEAPKIIKLGGE